ncbi:AAA family ATPase [Candidatus Kaiserbacteria bacterium]|nr:AAA family ATPase [Candidatus Kaiserbacteria bacterium]
MTQSEALDILKTGGNVFLTGEPGAGKTYVLNQYIEWLEACDVSVAVTASTGIAATHIGGMTIHAWSGIGARDELSAYDLDAIANKEKIVKRVRKTKVLVIDEISMLDGRLLDMVDKVCKVVRGNTEPFGGLQTVLVGDFFQLPPIARRGDMHRFAFESNAWNAARFLTCYITEQHRQEDEMLLGLLTSIRKNEIEEEHYTLLGEQTEIEQEHIEPTRLFTHNKDVDAMNETELKKLSTESATFKMEGRGSKPLLEGLKKNCLSPELLELRTEAMVMCTKNNFEAGYVNGTLGRVVSFDSEDGYPVIETGTGKEIKVMPASWSVSEDNKVLAEISQVPLRLAWAITIHKSQGMSLDAAEIDLRNAFTYGQGYVALSRVRTLSGMKVLGLNANALMVDPKIIRMDERFHIESEQAEEAFADMDKEDIEKMHHNFIEASGGKIPKDGDVSVRKSRMSTGSTYEETKDLLKEKKSVETIAKERKMAPTTIWGHLEKLAEDGVLKKKDVEHLLPTHWDTLYSDVTAAIAEHSAEKLKPLFEATGEQYDYNDIRLARLVHSLHT